MAAFNEHIEVCNCDPLKKLVRNFYHEALKPFNLTHDELGKINCFLDGTTICTRVTKNLNFKVSSSMLSQLRSWSRNCIKKRNQELDESGVDFYMKSGLDDMEKFVSKNYDRLAIEGSSITMEGKNIWFSLRPEVACKAIIDSILKDAPGCHTNVFNVVILKDDQSADNNLLYYRRHLTIRMIMSLCHRIGHEVTENDGKWDFHQRSAVAILAASTTRVEGAIQLKFGNIFSRHHNKSNVDIPSSEVFKQRAKKLEEISRGRTNKNFDSPLTTESAKNLAVATVCYDILSKSPVVDLNLTPDEDDMKNHAAVTIMYNYARTINILKKFHEGVTQNHYKDKGLKSLSFNHIGEREGEVDLLQILMQWRIVLETSVNFVRLECNYWIIAKYLLVMSRALNLFYKANIVLVSAQHTHQHPRMLARIYLLKAVRAIYETAFEAMSIKYN